jgi:hypothetical protein
LEHFLFFHILGIIIPTDFHIFQRGRYTTNQYRGSLFSSAMFGIFMADITGDGTGKPWKPWRKATRNTWTHFDSLIQQSEAGRLLIHDTWIGDGHP